MCQIKMQPQGTESGQYHYSSAQVLHGFRCKYSRDLPGFSPWAGRTRLNCAYRKSPNFPFSWRNMTAPPGPGRTRASSARQITIVSATPGSLLTGKSAGSSFSLLRAGRIAAFAEVRIGTRHASVLHMPILFVRVLQQYSTRCSTREEKIPERGRLLVVARKRFMHPAAGLIREAGMTFKKAAHSTSANADSGARAYRCVSLDEYDRRASALRPRCGGVARIPRLWISRHSHRKAEDLYIPIVAIAESNIIPRKCALGIVAIKFLLGFRYEVNITLSIILSRYKFLRDDILHKLSFNIDAKKCDVVFPPELPVLKFFFSDFYSDFSGWMH
jgi:hypothetical protein